MFYSQRKPFINKEEEEVFKLPTTCYRINFIRFSAAFTSLIVRFLAVPREKEKGVEKTLSETRFDILLQFIGLNFLS